MKRFCWTEQAKGDIRQIERELAMQILLELTKFAKTGEGDIKRLKAPDQYRLRVGDYRVRFKLMDDEDIRIVRVPSGIARMRIEVDPS